MAIEIPLKQKYLDYKPKGNKSSSNSSLKKSNTLETGLAPRRVNYGPFWWIDQASTKPIGS